MHNKTPDTRLDKFEDVIENTVHEIKEKNFKERKYEQQIKQQTKSSD